METTELKYYFRAVKFDDGFNCWQDDSSIVLDSLLRIKELKSHRLVVIRPGDYILRRFDESEDYRLYTIIGFLETSACEYMIMKEVEMEGLEDFAMGIVRMIVTD